MNTITREETQVVKGKKIRSILISQPAPANGRSPYFDLAEKFNIQVDFHPFIRVEGVNVKDFRKQKVDLAERTAVVFTSRHAIDHFFRICEEMKVKISPEMRYFCVSETVALYLQKFIQYRKRKVFFPADGRVKGLLEIMTRYKASEKFVVPCSEQSKDDIPQWLKKNKCDFKKAILYQTVGNQVKEVIANRYDMIVFFSPSGVKSLLDNVPEFNQNETSIAAFGTTTSKAVKESGLRLDLKAPMPNAPSMVAALENFLKEDKD